MYLQNNSCLLNEDHDLTNLDQHQQHLKESKAEKVRQMKKDLSLPLETIKLFTNEEKQILVIIF